MVATVVGALGVVGLEVLLGLHLGHRRALASITAVMSTKVVGVKLHSSGWWGSNRKNSRRADGGERALHTGPGGEAAGAADGGVGDRMVGVEGIGVGVGDQHVGGELADLVGDPLQRVAVDLQRVVAEVQAAEVGAEMRRRPRSASPWRIFLTFSIVWPSSFHSSPDSPFSP